MIRIFNAFVSYLGNVGPTFNAVQGRPASAAAEISASTIWLTVNY